MDRKLKYCPMHLVIRGGARIWDLGGKIEKKDIFGGRAKLKKIKNLRVQILIYF
jgi:hypothetical protein